MGSTTIEATSRRETPASGRNHKTCSNNTARSSAVRMPYHRAVAVHAPSIYCFMGFRWTCSQWETRENVLAGFKRAPQETLVSFSLLLSLSLPRKIQSALSRLLYWLLPGPSVPSLLCLANQAGAQQPPALRPRPARGVRLLRRRGGPPGTRPRSCSTTAGRGRRRREEEPPRRRSSGRVGPSRCHDAWWHAKILSLTALINRTD
jgi:hypothetical protein